MKVVEFVWLAIVAALVGALGGFVGSANDSPKPAVSAAAAAVSVIAAAYSTSASVVSPCEGKPVCGPTVHEVQVSPIADPSQGSEGVGHASAGATDRDGGGDSEEDDDHGDDNDDNDNMGASDYPACLGEHAGMLAQFDMDSSIAPDRGHGRNPERPPRS